MSLVQVIIRVKDGLNILGSLLHVWIGLFLQRHGVLRVDYTMHFSACNWVALRLVYHSGHGLDHVGRLLVVVVVLVGRVGVDDGHLSLLQDGDAAVLA